MPPPSPPLFPSPASPTPLLPLEDLPPVIVTPLILTTAFWSIKKTVVWLLPLMLSTFAPGPVMVNLLLFAIGSCPFIRVIVHGLAALQPGIAKVISSSITEALALIIAARREPGVGLLLSPLSAVVVTV